MRCGTGEGLGSSGVWFSGSRWRRRSSLRRRHAWTAATGRASARSTTVDTASVLVAGERHDGFVVGSPDETVLVRGERHVDHATGGEPITVVRGQDYKRYWAPSGVQPANQYAGYVRMMPDDYGTIAGGQPVQVASEPNGFHWRDGLVGALAALGLALLAFGALLGTQRRRHRDGLDHEAARAGRPTRPRGSRPHDPGPPGENGGMRVSAKVDYALRAALELAAAGDGPTKGERISQAQDIPLKFLENILLELRHDGLVQSQRGADGGYWLARPPEEIKLADVIRAVEGPLANVRGARPETVEYAGAGREAPGRLGRAAGEPARGARGADARRRRLRRAPPTIAEITAQPGGMGVLD